MRAEDKLRKIIANPLLYIEHFMKIVDKKGKLVKFKLNPQQKELHYNLEKYNVVLKSRQLGISSYSVAYSICLAQTQPNSTCLLVSYSNDSATAIFEKLKQLYNDMVEPLKVPLIANNRKELKFTNGSRIVVCTVGSKDIARGMSIKFCHVSEIAFCRDTIPKQLLAIEQAMLPDGKIILESTANGLGFFSELYAKAERGENLYKPFFFNWYHDKLMFADEYKQFELVWLKKHKALPTMEELDEQELEYIRDGATISQIVWRRLKIGNSDEASFRQEYPSNSVEAFMTTGSNIFQPIHVASRMSFIHEVVKIDKPSDLPDSLNHWFNRGLTMWAEVEEKMKYFVGVDCAEGVGLDDSCFEIFDKNGKQVAEFKNNLIKPYEFTEIVNDIGTYYNRAMLIVEKASSGHTVLEKLRLDYRYPNIYKQIEYDNTGKGIPKIGFTMTTKHKPRVINNFVELFETNQILINSKDLLNEMKTFAFQDGTMNAIRGQHDDLVIATALSLHGLSSGVQYV